MNTLFIFLLTFVAIDCNAFEAIDNKTSQTSSSSPPTNDPELPSDPVSHKAMAEVALLKKNMNELQSAFAALQQQLDHMNKHLSFHEKALKHIAVWGHRPERQRDDIDLDVLEISSNNETVSRKQSERDDKARDHDHGHHHSHHHRQKPVRHHHHHHSDHHPGNNGCSHCNPGHPHIVADNESDLNKWANNKTDSSEEKTKDSNDKSSEENSSEESVSKPIVTTNQTASEEDSELKNNTNIGSVPMNDSQRPNSVTKEQKRVRLSKTVVEEQLYFQSKESEFKEWFDNMLNDIHRQPSDRSEYGLQANKRSDQSAVDEMENALNSDDLVFATCNVKANRHITLLNQQDVEGTVNMWQLTNNRGPLYMHIKLKGFKVANHADHGKVRRERETILVPVEQEPDAQTPVGASHSHGFHVHEFGDLSRDCQSVGNHYNPLNLSHGGPYDVIRHVGDLGNIRCDANGRIDAEYTYSQVSLSGPHSIINRSLVIHSNIDDFGRKPNNPSSAQTGSSGVRIACCVIEEVKQLPKDPDSESSIGSVAVPLSSGKRKRDTSEPVLRMVRKSNQFEKRHKQDVE